MTVRYEATFGVAFIKEKLEPRRYEATFGVAFIKEKLEPRQIRFYFNFRKG